jgi:AraC family transcriptional regulator of adaptative response / DNA-3-methyladenine glycosylase II
MTFDPATCYQAVLSRDARFDGRFFTGVVSTGVYCRPICPARPPRFENVRFFPCAAAAEAAGFRPCRRCRPDTAPGTPAWIGTSALVSRGVRLIMEGALDEDGVEALAARLGVGARHLRRLFTEHVGASPVAVALTRRVHFARKLIDETDLPMADVAFAAQFSSIRRFNAAMRRAFSRTPTDLRRDAQRRGADHASRGLVLRLPFRPPFDWDGMLAFLAPRAIPGVEAVRDGVYRRTMTVGGDPGAIEVSADALRPQLLIRIFAGDPRGLMDVVGRARRLFDLGADPAEITSRLASHPVLASRLGARPGLRVPGAWDGFELAVRATLGQQVSVKAATTLAGRLAARYGEPCTQEGAPGLTVLFPRPEVLAAADLTSVGLTRARAVTVASLAAAVRDGVIDFDTRRGLEDAIVALTRLPGIGGWTAEYIAMRALGEPDAFPASDLGLRRAASDGGAMLSAAALDRLSEAWRPWRAYAAVALWTGPVDRG